MYERSLGRFLVKNRSRRNNIYSSGLDLYHIYSILLPEQEECSLSSLLNISIDKLKQILLTCGLMYYQRGPFKIVLNGRSICMMDNDLKYNYFDKFNVGQFNYHQRNIYNIGIFTSRDNRMNPSSQFFNYSFPRKSRSIINKLKKKCDRMNMLLKKNGMLQDGLVDILNTIIIKCLFKSIIKFQKKRMISIHFVLLRIYLNAKIMEMILQ